MAPRPFWTGYLKLSLVTCPVALTAATSDADRVRFHTLNRRTGNRVVSRYVDGATGQPGRRREPGQGLRPRRRAVRSARGRMNSQRSSSRARAPSTSRASRRPPAWTGSGTSPLLSDAERPVGEEAYCVIRDAMRSTGLVGTSPASSSSPRARRSSQGRATRESNSGRCATAGRCATRAKFSARIREDQAQSRPSRTGFAADRGAQEAVEPRHGPRPGPGASGRDHRREEEEHSARPSPRRRRRSRRAT